MWEHFNKSNVWETFRWRLGKENIGEGSIIVKRKLWNERRVGNKSGAGDLLSAGCAYISTRVFRVYVVMSVTTTQLLSSRQSSHYGSGVLSNPTWAVGSELNASHGLFLACHVLYVQVPLLGLCLFSTLMPLSYIFITSPPSLETNKAKNH